MADVVRHALGDGSRWLRDPLRWPFGRNGVVGVDEKRRTQLMVIVSKCFVAMSVAGDMPVARRDK